MFGNLGDMGKLISQMQESAKELDSKLQSQTFSVKSGGGMVEILANAKGEVIDINIDDSLLEDKDSLQILLITTINDLFSTIEKNRQASAMSMLNNLNMFGAKP